MYAVNITDLLKFTTDLPLLLLLRPVLNKDDKPISCERGRIDGGSIPLRCPNEQAQAICKVVRQHYKKHELRLYHSRTGKGGWKRI